MSVTGRQAISDVLIHYATTIDRRDWKLLASCFTPVCDLEYGRFGHFSSRGEVVEFMRDAHAEVGPTLHRLSNIVIDVTGDLAEASTYVHVLLMPGRDRDPIHQAAGRDRCEAARTLHRNDAALAVRLHV